MKTERKRYYLLDEIRGITLLSMIAFHGVWDLVYIFGKEWKWFFSDASYWWQQSICWTFIFLSGFCFSLGRAKLKRGLLVFGAGAIVSMVTMLFMPAQCVRYGVLTLLGSCMLLLYFLEKILEKLPALVGMTISMFLFFLTRNVNEGYFGFEDFRLLKLPISLYEKNEFMTYLGFPYRGFYSTDYFSLIPWLFLFVSGYYFFKVCKQKEWLGIFAKSSPLSMVLQPIGKYSLWIYLLHQPVIYGVLWILA